MLVLTIEGFGCWVLNVGYHQGAGWYDCTAFRWYGYFYSDEKLRAAGFSTGGSWNEEGLPTDYWTGVPLVAVNSHFYDYNSFFPYSFLPLCLSDLCFVS